MRYGGNIRDIQFAERHARLHVERRISHARIRLSRYWGEEFAAAYLGDFEETERPECFDKSIKRLGEFSRVGVRREYQRKGYAERLLRFLLKEAVNLGYDGLVLLVAAENFGAMALYEKIGFRRVGEGVMYDTHWFFYEIMLKRCAND